MQAKLDCPARHAKIPTADFEAIFAEDFFDLTTESPSLASAMSAPSEHREGQEEMVGISLALDAKTRRSDVEAMLILSRVQVEAF